MILEGKTLIVCGVGTGLGSEIADNFSIPKIPNDDDIAEAVVFLASERARMITGQCLMVNSGQLMT